VLTSDELSNWLDILTLDDCVEAIGVLMVTVDESIVAGGPRRICVASCVATARQWKLLADEWRPTASKYEPKGYHAVAASVGDNAILAELIRKRLTIGLAVTIEYGDYEAVVPKRLRGEFGAEYETCCRICLMLMAKWCDRQNVRWLAWIVEKGMKGVDPFKNILDGAVGVPKWHVFSATLVDKGCLPSHAADLVAHLTATDYGNPPSPELKLMENVVCHRQITRDELVATVEMGMETIRKRTRAKTLRRRQGKPKPRPSSDL
jgi:hypothetical protein